MEGPPKPNEQNDSDKLMSALGRPGLEQLMVSGTFLNVELVGEVEQNEFTVLAE